MAIQTRFMSSLDLTIPIIQAPMNGGPSTAELVSAVSNKGGLGSIGASALSPEALELEITKIKTLTNRPFNINLFVLQRPEPDHAAIADAIALLDPIHNQLGIQSSATPSKFCEDFQKQVEVLIEMVPAVVSFTFGIIDAQVVEKLKSKGSYVIGTATNTTEAVEWERIGADAICAQGHEAGGHRGTFIGTELQSSIGTLALVPQVCDAVTLPVIAAGGIMDGRGIAASLALGAQAVQMGTAFLTCEEARINKAWKEKIRSSQDWSTVLTRLFSGRYARGINNEFIEQLREYEERVPLYPIQNALTGALRKEAARTNHAEYLSLWAGQSSGLSRNRPENISAPELIDVLMNETCSRLSKMAEML